MKRWSFVSMVLAAGLVLAACAPAATPAPTSAPAPTQVPTAEPTPAPQDIVAIAAGDGRFTTLVAAVEAAGLVATLQGDGPFTVFAPTDDAFAKLPAGTLDELLKPENKQQLIDILLYHVVPGQAMAADVAGMDMATTALAEQSLAFKLEGDRVFVNDAQVLITDIEASNGVIHVIDTVLLPPAPLASIAAIAAGDDRFETLVAALQAADLVETLQGDGQFTVFAPTDEAFAKLPAETLAALLKPENKQQLTDILLYHVVPGEFRAADVAGLTGAATALADQSVTFTIDGDKVFVNDAQVLITDIAASNGVIHVIDTVITPAPPSIAAIAAGDERFTTLVAALDAAGLVETLQGDGPFTVFAPTNDAFAKLPAGTLEELLKPENRQRLTDILLYHVVPGQVLAADVVQLDAAETALAGQSVTITVDGDKVFVNDAQVLITDIAAGNGVIHVIDTVLLPK